MIPKYRKAFNSQFSQDTYDALMNDVIQSFDYTPKFKIAETPVFIPALLKKRLIEACNDIMSVINQPNFKSLTEGAFFDEKMKVPNEDDHSKFVQFDFGICLDDKGHPTPKLIELQGFPSLYFFQDFMEKMYKKHYSIPEGLSIHPLGQSSEEFIELLRTEIVGETNPKQVILLEIEPEKQATAIDFYCTEAMLGIKILCISKLIKRGKSLFYLDDEGKEIQILKCAY